MDIFLVENSMHQTAQSPELHHLSNESRSFKLTNASVSTQAECISSCLSNFVEIYQKQIRMTEKAKAGYTTALDPPQHKYDKVSTL